MTNQEKKSKVSSSDLKEMLKTLNAAYRVEKQSDESDLFAGGVLDSLSLIQFVMAIEKRFQIRLANDDITYESFRTLQLITDLLNRKYLH